MLWKRAIKQTIFAQIIIFSISAIYNVVKDKQMELMIFGTGHIYRRTGKTNLGATSSCIEAGRCTQSRRNSTVLLGKEVLISTTLELRVKWGQRVAAIFAPLGFGLFFFGDMIL